MFYITINHKRVALTSYSKSKNTIIEKVKKHNERSKNLVNGKLYPAKQSRPLYSGLLCIFVKQVIG